MIVIQEGVSVMAFKKRNRWEQAALTAKQWDDLFVWAAEMKRLLPHLSADVIAQLSKKRSLLMVGKVKFPRWTGRAHLDQAAIEEAWRHIEANRRELVTTEG
jgi:hypothetical protein